MKRTGEEGLNGEREVLRLDVIDRAGQRMTEMRVLLRWWGSRVKQPSYPPFMKAMRGP